MKRAAVSMGLARRALLSVPLLLVGPAANLWGSGSWVLSLQPRLARSSRLDTFYPVADRPGYPYRPALPPLDYDGGYKRYYDERGRYEFRYPTRYVQDRTVFLSNADAGYARRSMDPTLAAAPTARPTRQRSGPEVAFGPANSKGEENLSVVVGQLQPGFTLRGTLGDPEEGATRLLELSIAKPNVRKPTLLAATERMSERSGKPLYQFEYRVDYLNSNQEPAYTVCVVGANEGTLFTFASRVPAAVWAERADELREAAESFVLL